MRQVTMNDCATITGSVDRIEDNDMVVIVLDDGDQIVRPLRWFTEQGMTVTDGDPVEIVVRHRKQ